MTIVILKINQVSSGIANIIEEILITLYRPKLNIGSLNNFEYAEF